MHRGTMSTWMTFCDGMSKCYLDDANHLLVCL